MQACSVRDSQEVCPGLRIVPIHILQGNRKTCICNYHLPPPPQSHGHNCHDSHNAQDHMLRVTAMMCLSRAHSLSQLAFEFLGEAAAAGGDRSLRACPAQALHVPLSYWSAQDSDYENIVSKRSYMSQAVFVEPSMPSSATVRDSNSWLLWRHGGMQHHCQEMLLTTSNCHVNVLQLALLTTGTSG